MTVWHTTRFMIDLTTPQIMAIVNVTSDSFSDGGQHADTNSALKHCEQLIRDGADILDIGGESTRPGSETVPLQVELKRVLPVVREAVKMGVPVSVDTLKSEVMAAVLDLGADIINDVWALRQSGTLDVVSRHPNCGVCLMHMHRDPQTMQVAPMEGDVVPQVAQFFSHQAQALKDREVRQERIVLDPGIGFGKTVAQNFSLLARQAELLVLGYPLLIGWSRKSSLGAILQGKQPVPPKPQDRVMASVAAALLAIERGARVLRVHDVRQTVEARAVWLHTHQAA